MEICTCAGEGDEKLREKSNFLVQSAMFFQTRMVRNKKRTNFDRWLNQKKVSWENLSLIKNEYLLCFWHPLVWGVFPNQIHQLDLGSYSRHSYNFQKPESNLKFPLHLSCSAKPGKWILVCNFHWHKNSNC